MTIILLRIWPALIPLLLYLLWYDMQRRKAVREGQQPRRFKEGPVAITVIASLILAVAGLFWYGSALQSRNNVAYEPARIIDGQIVRGALTDKQK
jgi:uncharacterized iron-regulated membrane protein